MFSYPALGLVIIGDEILSGKRRDKHLEKTIELLNARAMALAWARCVGDAPQRITDLLGEVFAGNDLVFCCGGIGATPDDHTRQCAAAALGVPLELHPKAVALIEQRSRENAEKDGIAYDPDLPENIQKLEMGRFPQGSRLIPNPYNQIPGFSCGSKTGAQVHFFPGFPVMAWPMMEWVLEHEYAHLHGRMRQSEKSLLVLQTPESRLTPLMQAIEARFSNIKVFSLPCVDHATLPRHIELGVKGPQTQVTKAYETLLNGLRALGLQAGKTYGEEGLEVFRPAATQSG